MLAAAPAANFGCRAAFWLHMPWDRHRPRSAPAAGAAGDPAAAFADLYDGWYRSHRDDLAFYRGICRRRPGPVVELGAGTGRVTVPLLQDGREVIAVDRSPAMLERLEAAARAAHAAGRLTTVLSDLRAVTPPRTATVIAPFTVLMELTPRSRAGLFARLAGALAPGAVLAFDVWHCPPPYIDATDGRWLPSGPDTEARLTWDRPASAVAMEVRCAQREFALQFWFGTPEEWRRELEAAGFGVAVSGGFGGGPVSPRCRQLAIVARVPADGPGRSRVAGASRPRERGP